MIFGKKAEVEILTERPVYVAGETLNARVRIWGKGDLAIEEARVELQRHQKFEYKYRERDSDGRESWTTKIDTEHETYANERVLGQGQLTNGQFFEQFISFPLLDWYAPSGQASVLSTSWTLDLILDRRRALDISSRAKFTILTPAAQNSARIATRPRSPSAAICAVLPELAARDIQAGGVITGTIIVFARQPAEARAIRVELVRIEKTDPPYRSEPTRAGHSSTTVVKQQCAAGGALPVGVPWGFPFTIAVPPDVHPTTFTSRGDIRWLLRGVVDRSFAEDFTGEVEVNIANAPVFAAPPPPPGQQQPLAGALRLDATTFDGLDSDDEPTAAPSIDPQPAAPHATLPTLLLDAGADGPLAGQVFTLVAPLTSIGRREDNALIVPDQAVSRVHAAIRRESNTYLLRDLGSTTGTYVNGMPLTGEHPLQVGDIVGIGPAVTFVVRGDSGGG